LTLSVRITLSRILTIFGENGIRNLFPFFPYPEALSGKSKKSQPHHK
jgi:hypothetical protein